MNTPLVTICIPTYRGASFLEATIDSVLRQTYQNFEVWIFDDNSPDETTAVVSKLTDSRIHYVRNPQNLGPEGNWNASLKVVTGKYFKLLPHDDLLSADCLSQQVEVLENDRDQEISLVFGSRAIIDPKGKILMSRGMRHPRGRIAGSILVKKCIRAGTNIIGEPGNGLVRAELMKKIGAYDATFPYVVDLDCWFKVLTAGDGFYLDSESSSFRLSPGSWSVAIGKKQYDDFRGLINKVVSEGHFHITTADRARGLVQARLNSIARAITYKYFFRAKLSELTMEH